MTDPTPVPENPPVPPSRTPPPKRRRWWLWALGGVLGFFVVIIATVAITIWWIQRPIKPVVLSPEEKQIVETKMTTMRNATPLEANERLDLAQPATPQPPTAPTPATPPARVYQPGGKELRLTERELNGLLNANTELGDTVRIELDADAINAYLAVPIPKDFPVFGGTMFRARGRFRMSLSAGQPPVAMLEDISVLGLSLPKEWLGGVKGKNLLADAMGGPGQSPNWKGIKSLRIAPGAIVLEVGD